MTEARLSLWLDWYYEFFSALAWGTAAAGGVVFLLALAIWALAPARGQTRAELVIPLALALIVATASFLELPGSSYRYGGEDVVYAEVLKEFSTRDGGVRDPLVTNPMRRTMSRLHLGVLLVWQEVSFRVSGPQTVQPETSNAPEVEPIFGPDQPMGWRGVGIAIWALLCWFLYGLARRWGIRPGPAGLGVGLCLGAPAVIFHANCLSDHLLGALVIVVGLHLQLRRLENGQLFSPIALGEGIGILAAAFYTRWTSLFLLGPLLLLRLLSDGASRKTRLLHLGALLAGASLLVLPEVPRILKVGQLMTLGQFVDYPASDELSTLATLSTRNLVANLTPRSIAAFLTPAASMPFFILGLLGLITLWRTPPPGGRLAVCTVVVTVVLTVGINYSYMHPGSRTLLPLAFWASLLVARGLQSLWTIRGKRAWLSRAATLLLLFWAVQLSITSLEDLRVGWFPDAHPEFEALRRDLPEIPTGELEATLSRWSGGRVTNVIGASPNGPLFQPVSEGDPARLFRFFASPIVPWSSIFQDDPTVYVTTSDDYTWSANFMREHRIQMESLFEPVPMWRTGPFTVSVLPRVD